MSLDELSKKYKLDKNIASGCHNYIPGYTSLFDPIRNDVKHMLEIGIGSVENGQMSGVVSAGYKTGNSLKCWSEYFPSAMIYGIDIFEHPELDTDKIKTFVADQSSKHQLHSVIRSINASLDIIIDDGSHVGEHQAISFMILNAFLTPAGLYVIEDVQSPTIPKFLDLSIFPREFIPYLKENFDITYFDTRKTLNRADDFMVCFRRKTPWVNPPTFDLLKLGAQLAAKQ